MLSGHFSNLIYENWRRNHPTRVRKRGIEADGYRVILLPAALRPEDTKSRVRKSLKETERNFPARFTASGSTSKNRCKKCRQSASPRSATVQPKTRKRKIRARPSAGRNADSVASPIQFPGHNRGISSFGNRCRSFAAKLVGPAAFRPAPRKAQRRTTKYQDTKSAFNFQRSIFLNHKVFDSFPSNASLTA